MIEIERKFLVSSDAFKTKAFKENTIAQGYLSSVPERTVRVRIKGDKGFLTIKGISSASGLSRFEWAKEIPVEDAKKLILNFWTEMYGKIPEGIRSILKIKQILYKDKNFKLKFN